MLIIVVISLTEGGSADTWVRCEHCCVYTSVTLTHSVMVSVSGHPYQH